MKHWGERLKQGIFGVSWKEALVSIALGAGGYFISLIYGYLNHGPQVVVFKTALDDFIPMVKPFVIPYITLNPYIFFSLLVFLFFRIRLFQSATLAMITTWLISYLFYIVLQSYVARPVLTGNDLLTRLILNVYQMDNPYNCFPSLHTSLSTILAIHWLRFDRKIGIPFVVWTSLIVLSTMFIKQHYIADVAFGLVLAFSASSIFLSITGVNSRNGK